ncbi:hypothetical protein HGB47_14890 [Leptospira yasudae]|uniref:hypothetical protein n=1 Tax=Leptospira yasudae TaxID=2202201 RepID=UPI001C5008F0|nr:hypothetical protein [Leptospira yasudae]MBW0434903.1 hypothetical protein [Leptospira yasudae]
MSAIWFSLIEINRSISAASKRSQELANNLHGSGASMFACFTGFILFLTIAFQERQSEFIHWCFPVFIYVILQYAHWQHFKHVKDDHIVFVETAFDFSQNEKSIKMQLEKYKQV